MRRFLLPCAVLALCSLAWAADEDVAGWIKDLGSADAKTREAAAENLEKAGVRAKEALEAATMSDDPEVSSEAADILKHLDGSPNKENPPAPKQRATRQVRGTSVRIIMGAAGQTSIQEDSNGHVVVKETRDGKTTEYSADSREAFTEKYPEVAKKYGLDKDGSGFSFGSGKGTPEEQELEKRVEALRRETEERLRKLREGKDLDKDEQALRKALEDLRKGRKGQRSRFDLGAETGPVDDALRYQLDLPEGGVLVQSVEKESRAERLGLRKYDILLTLNGKPVSSEPEIRAALEAEGPATAEIVREGDHEALREKE